MNLQTSLQNVIDRRDLSREEMGQVMRIILEERCSTAQIAGFLVSLRSKGETVEEITGAVQVMRERMIPFQAPKDGVLDTCGTGGDGTGSINVSTLAALIAAGAGIPVAKHGNRSVSSQCGSADLLESLGVKIDLPVHTAEKMLAEIGITFLFAPLYHPAMKSVALIRKELGVRTLFNLLGPLCNPAGVRHQLVGVFSFSGVRLMAEVLANLGTKHLLAVHGLEGIDEISMSGPTRVCEWKEGKFSEYEITPEQFGFRRIPSSEIKGGTAQQNGKIALRVLNGEKNSFRDLVALNAGAAVYVADRAESIQQGIQLAQHSLDSGKALEKLELLQKYSKGVV